MVVCGAARVAVIDDVCVVAYDDLTRANLCIRVVTLARRDCAPSVGRRRPVKRTIVADSDG